MGKLGISIYPEKSTEKEINEYIDKAYKQGFSRIFSCLLSVTENKEHIINKFKSVANYAKEKGFEIVYDVNPRVLKDLGIEGNDFGFFKEIGADGIRLDGGFGGLQESVMSFNDENLKIEINMSNNTNYIDTIMDYRPKKENLIACHNFYPHKYSGLDFDYFMQCTKRFNKYGLRTAAFVTSQNDSTFGPWPVSDKLPTLEMHRDLPIEVQAKHIIALECIDDIIISNCYPTDKEIEALGNMRKDMVTFDVIINKETPEFERNVVFNDIHLNRGDISGKLIRSSGTRFKYKGHDFKKFNTPEKIKKGDILIDSNEYGSYEGELQIAADDMINTGRTNVVGRVRDEEVFILDYIKPWQKFNFNFYAEE